MQDDVRRWFKQFDKIKRNQIIASVKLCALAPHNIYMCGHEYFVIVLVYLCERENRRKRDTHMCTADKLDDLEELIR